MLANLRRANRDLTKRSRRHGAGNTLPLLAPR
jgi:hypothetical protein